MTVRSAVHTEVICDVCEYVLCKRMPEAEALADVVNRDAGWRQFANRLVCEDCIGERVCRIFGHHATYPDEGGPPYCERCWEGVR